MSTSKREESKQKTRQTLIAAGAAEFTENGIEGSSLDAICARAGLTRGAFYVHFKDRDDLLKAIVEALLEGFYDSVIASGDDNADLETTISKYVAAAVVGVPATRSIGKWQFHNTLAACARSPAMRERYVDLQRDAMARIAKATRASQEAGKVRADIEPETLAEILVTLTVGVSVMRDLKFGLDIGRAGALVSTLLRPQKKPTR